MKIFQNIVAFLKNEKEFIDALFKSRKTKKVKINQISYLFRIPIYFCLFLVLGYFVLLSSFEIFVSDSSSSMTFLLYHSLTFSAIALWLVVFLRHRGMNWIYGLRVSLIDMTNLIENTGKEYSTLMNQLQEWLQSHNASAKLIRESAVGMMHCTALLGIFSKKSRSFTTMTSEINQKVATAISTLSDQEELANKLVDSIKTLQKINGIIEQVHIQTNKISQISTKSQLLGFNATIEAQEAGEYGKGFGVLAQEINRLAEISSQSSREISALVNHSRGEVDSYVEGTIGLIKKGQGIIQDTKIQLELIRSFAVDIESDSKIVCAEAEEQRLGIADITSKLEAVHEKSWESWFGVQKSVVSHRKLDTDFERLSRACSLTSEKVG